MITFVNVTFPSIQALSRIEIPKNERRPPMVVQHRGLAFVDTIFFINVVQLNKNRSTTKTAWKMPRFFQIVKMY